MRELERRVLLEVIDRKWREHLYEMDYLKDGVGLRAYAQRDPLVEYQREGFDMFNQMLDGVKEEAVGFLFNLEVQVEQAPQEVTGVGAAPVSSSARGSARAAQRRQQQLLYSAPAIDGAAGAARPGAWFRRRRRRHSATGGPARRVGAGSPGRAGGQQAAGGGSGRRFGPVPQRALPVRLRQEVQALPRSPRPAALDAVPTRRCGNPRAPAGLGATAAASVPVVLATVTVPRRALRESDGCLRAPRGGCSCQRPRASSIRIAIAHTLSRRAMTTAISATPSLTSQICTLRTVTRSPGPVRGGAPGPWRPGCGRRPPRLGWRRARGPRRRMGGAGG